MVQQKNTTFRIVNQADPGPYGPTLFDNGLR